MNDKIQKFQQQALSQGYSPEEVDAFIAQQSGQQPTPTVQQPVQPQPQVQPQKDMVSKVGEGAINLGKSLAKPFVKTGQNIGTAAVTVPQAVLASLVSRVNAETGAKIASQDILGTQKRAEEVSKDPKKALKEQAKASAGVASWTIPFGKGANIASKAVLPGAGVGGLQALSEDDATLESVVGGATLGAAGGTALYGASKVPGLLKGAGKTVEKVGTKARTGSVSLKGSISGAGEEKAVVKVMEKYGIKGTPQ